jgi:hypothetical protein
MNTKPPVNIANIGGDCNNPETVGSLDKYIGSAESNKLS